MEERSAAAVCSIHVCTFERVVRWEGENLNKMRAIIYSRVGWWEGGFGG